MALLGVIVISAVADTLTVTDEKKLMRADQHALNYMVEEDYDPQGLINLMKKLNEPDHMAVPHFFDYYKARPVTEERIEQASKAFSRLPLENKSFDVHHSRYQEMTKGIQEIYKVA